jgi:photosystem II stability/assembly factor-like uncharacterized protein
LICRLRLALASTALIFALICPRAYAISWFAEGPDGGDAKDLAADPRDPAHLYLGAADGWIYQSQDGGAKWERLALVGKRDDLVIRHILVDPTDPKHLVVGAYVVSDGGGVYVSHDAGATWTSQPEMQGQSVRSLTFAPSDPKILVAGTLEGVFRSTDSGEHWERISPKDSTEIHEVESLAIDPADANVIYAGTWHLGWKTIDGGKHWTSLKQGVIEDSDVFSIIVDPKQPNTVYLSACSGIYKSVNAGGQFVGGVGKNKAQGIPSDARRTRVLKQDPNNPDTVFAGTTEGLYRTFDAGKYWMQTTDSDVIVNDVYVDPANSKHVLLATDRRGVLASEDGGDSCLPSNSGFSARQITAYSGDVHHGATVYVGVVNDKDSGGVFVSHTGGLTWAHLSSGLDGHDVFSLGQAPDGTILAGTERGIYRLMGGDWQRAGDDASGTAGSAAPAAESATPQRAAVRSKTRQRGSAKGRAAAEMVKDFEGSVYALAASGETLVAATSQGVLRSDSSGVSWSYAGSFPPEDWRYAAAAKGTFVVGSLKTVEISTDDASTWRVVALPPGVAQVLVLSVDAQGEVWVGDRAGVYVSADKGATWQTVTTLVVRNVNSLFYDEQGDRMLVTSRDPATVAYSVNAKTKQVTSWETGWKLRFVRPVGDHLVAATLFDGMVVQPRMVDSADVTRH